MRAIRIPVKHKSTRLKWMSKWTTCGLIKRPVYSVAVVDDDLDGWMMMTKVEVRSDSKCLAKSDEEKKTN